MTAPEAPKKYALSWLVDPVWANLEPFLDKKFDELTDKVLALLPLLAAAAGTAAGDRVIAGAKGIANGVLDGDPDIPVLSDIVDVSEMIRSVVNGGTPVGVHIPGLDALGALFNRQPGL